MERETKTTQIGLRLENDLLKKIEKLANSEGIDRMAWIKRALGVFVGDEEAGMMDEAIEDYIHLRIDENELKNISGIKKVPIDVQEARKITLKSIINKREER